jgi:hypothetical protein
MMDSVKTYAFSAARHLIDAAKIGIPGNLLQANKKAYLLQKAGMEIAKYEKPGNSESLSNGVDEVRSVISEIAKGSGDIAEEALGLINRAYHNRNKPRNEVLWPIDYRPVFNI